MRNIYSLLLAFVITSLSLAQAPQTMSYQAVIRDASGGLITEQEIGMQISIQQGSTDGTVVYTETQTPTTNKNGLVSIEIGGEAGFSDIDWSDGPYFIKTETDPEGGTNYTITGTSQLLSVPYALHSGSSDVLTGEISESQISDLQNYLTEETDPLFDASPAAVIESSDIDNWDEAHGWGNHAEANYLAEEADPQFTASVVSDITQEDIESWDAKSEFDGEFSSLTGVPNSVIMPAGVINIFAGSISPDGYLICDGSPVSRTEYADLFAVIGTTYGEGDGSTTFNLPDLQSRIPVGISAEPEFDELGKTGGAKDHVLTVDEMPAHSHAGSTGEAGGHDHGGNTSSSGGHSHTGSTATAGTHSHSGTTNAAGAHTHTYSRRDRTLNSAGGIPDFWEAGGLTTVNTSTSGNHSHSFTTSTAEGHTHSLSIASVANHSHIIAADGSHEHTVSIGESGGGIAHNNLQPYIVLNFIIKY